jgi:hypothetical protein
LKCGSNRLSTANTDNTEYGYGYDCVVGLGSIDASRLQNYITSKTTTPVTPPPIPINKPINRPRYRRKSFCPGLPNVVGTGL